MSYSPNNPKIDLYVDGRYAGSTNWSRTQREAKKRYAEKHNIDISRIRAAFGK